MSEETTMERNADLFREVAAVIAADPASYDQGTWVAKATTACGTRSCVAGWACLLTNDELAQELLTLDDTEIALGHQPASDERDDKIFALYQRRWELWGLIPDRAEDVLGLTPEDAEKLFNAYWVPAPNLTVSEALEKVGAGASIEDVSGGTWDEYDAMWSEDEDEDE